MPDFLLPLDPLGFPLDHSSLLAGRNLGSNAVFRTKAYYFDGHLANSRAMQLDLKEKPQLEFWIPHI